MAGLARLWQFLIFGALSVVVLAILGYAWFTTFDLRTHGVRATGQVVQVSDSPSRALLQVPGRAQGVWVDVPYHDFPHVGDRLDVLYDPARPSINTEGHRIDYVSPSAFTAILLLVATGVAWFGARRDRLRRAARRPAA